MQAGQREDDWERKKKAFLSRVEERKRGRDREGFSVTFLRRADE